MVEKKRWRLKLREGKQHVKEYILSRCAQPLKERDIVASVHKKFDVSNGTAFVYIKELKQDGLLFTPKKNALLIVR